MPQDRKEYYKANKYIWEQSYLKNKDKRLARNRNWAMNNKEYQ